MSTTKAKVAEQEPLFGKKEKALLRDPLLDNNPITVQVLGVCSALAVTSLVYPSLVMAVAVVFVTAASNLVTSLLRNTIPKAVRLIVQLVIIATLVTLVNEALKAVNFPIYKQLSVYIGLIITNCIVMGRLEAFAMANKPWRSFLDGIGNGLGYGLILVAVGFVRELFGKGSLFAGSPIAIQIIGPGENYLIDTATTGQWGNTFFGWYANNNLMVMSVAAMFVIAVMIWWQRARNPKLVDIS
ncbi:NADH:ubiquinone reductase (Na(+)-transporting) subunit D [Neolewinella lacunae]|uniref:Na(+)-translocating NADH-quinone reductase subunit D n=1 Tax=Neolewinella lacunae TaxID=1517758 RepID=A0A923PQN9_9BACT|nr:NADH:ubiquinone reductase (Na(+)-transporting) subunit D [Neolewinella lacunae]MBC6995719.1 NADH:ubiquinone reductase (Na(+)-transporting) subunit D [Neolewinella lacunae]MDN3636588.1 NADH:ubiquinone reductase (Na(+)-transporting) subunit D [Neolewinella lacunae]